MIGRWHSVDPLAEKYYSWPSYNFTFNNPINYLDPDGKQVRVESYAYKKYWANMHQPMHPEFRSWVNNTGSLFLDVSAGIMLPASLGLSSMISGVSYLWTLSVENNRDRKVSTLLTVPGFFMKNKVAIFSLIYVQIIYDITKNNKIDEDLNDSDSTAKADNTRVVNNWSAPIKRKWGWGPSVGSVVNSFKKNSE